MSEYNKVKLEQDTLRKRFIGTLTEDQQEVIRCWYNAYAEEQNNYTVRNGRVMNIYHTNEAFIKALKDAEEFDDEWHIYVEWLKDLLFNYEHKKGSSL